MPNQKSNSQYRASYDHFSPYSKPELGDKLGTAPGQKGSSIRELRDQVRAVLSNQRVHLTVTALASRHRRKGR